MQMQASGRIFQERADNSLQPWACEHYIPLSVRTIDAYRRTLLIQAKRQLPDDHPLRSVQIKRLASDALDALEPQIYDACQTAAYDMSSVPVDAPLRRVEERDTNGLTTVRWVGQRFFVRDIGRMGRRVVSFRTPRGYVDASGRALR